MAYLSGSLYGKGYEMIVRPGRFSEIFTWFIFWCWSVGNGFRMHEEHSNCGQLVGRMETKTSIREVAELDGRKLSLASQLEPEGYNREHCIDPYMFDFKSKLAHIVWRFSAKI